MLIKIELLLENCLNANVMDDSIRNKLKENIKRSGKYPPLIIRKISEPPSDFDIKNTVIAKGEGVIGAKVLSGFYRLIALSGKNYVFGA